jgi:DHA1 family multidrug resistance protein-like MFS transporter
VLNIATLYHAGTLSDRFGRKPVIWPSTVIAGLSMLAFAASGGYLAFIGSALLWGLASGISGPSPGAYIADLAPPERRGRVIGAFRTCSDAGYIVGPLLLGWLADVAGFTVPLVTTAILFAVAGGLFGLLAPETHRRTPPAAS